MKASFLNVAHSTRFSMVTAIVEPIEALKGTEKFLKVPLRGTFKNFSGFYEGAKCLKPISD